MRLTGRKIISATISSSFVLWLDKASSTAGVPKSRLLEEGLWLLKKKMEEEQESSFQRQLNEGIDRILASGEDQVAIAESSADRRIGEELL